MIKKITFVVLVLCSILTLAMGCKNRFDQYTRVDTHSELSLTVNSHLNDRGGSIINDKYLLQSSCPLITDDKELIKQNKNEFYFASFMVPYQLYKKSGEDIFYIIKDNDSLKYELISIEKTE